MAAKVLVPLIPGVTPAIRGRNDLDGLAESSRMAKKIKRAASRVSLASNLRAARALFNWSQEQLGLQCGLKRTYVGALERREVNPGIDNLDRLAIGVGVASYVLLLSPDQAYREIYAAYALSSRLT